MNTGRLREFCEQVSRELGVEIAPPTAEDDGLELPFATLFPRTGRTAAADGWVRFGCDNYFSDFLCRNGSVALWDREIGGRIEPTHEDMADLLTDVYEAYLQDGPADVIVTRIPDGLERVVAILKPPTSMRSADLLTALRTLPATFTGIDCAAGIRAVRELHACGVTCHLSGVRDRFDD